jgi:hypothetical protein
LSAIVYIGDQINQVEASAARSFRNNCELANGVVIEDKLIDNFFYGKTQLRCRFVGGKK